MPTTLGTIGLLLRSSSMVDSQTNLPRSLQGIGPGDWELFLDLDAVSPGPLHSRIRSALRDAIRVGRLRRGTALPASRRLATELNCSRWAVTEAYAQLIAEGYLEATPGSATRVAWQSSADAGHARRPPRHVIPDALAALHDLAPGLPDVRAFPRRRWADAVRVATTGAEPDQLGYPDPSGLPRLRSVVAEHAVRTRAAVVAADDVVVVTSVTDAVRRLCRVLRAQGVKAVACEDPGWTRLRDVVASSGLRVVAVPVDDHGLRTDLLREHRGVRAALVTPAHQFPSGVVLSPDRRAELLRWAAEVDGLVLEDDYDAEFRYDRDPVAALQGMDPSRVVLMKSVSKTLAPAVGIGYLVAPGRWCRVLLDETPDGVMPPALDQLAFARLVESGAYDRHLRACRTSYRRRRDRLVAAVASALPDARMTGVAAGLHLVLWLPPGVRATDVTDEAARRGVRVVDLARYRATTTAQPEALVLGYGNLTEHAVASAVHILASAVAAVRP